MKLHSLVFLLLCLGIVSCNSNRNTTQSDCLKNIAYKIETLDMQDDDSDLSFLKKILDNDSVKIVLLGEQGHYDGTTFSGKARLIKFLHEKCGYDVLAFESGFYDCAKGWELAQQYNDYEIGLKGSIFGLWSYAKEFQPLTEYLNSTLKSSNPVILAGIDNALTGSFSTDYFISDLDKLNLLKKDPDESQKLSAIIRGQMPNPFSPGAKPDTAEINNYVNLLDAILSRLDTLKSSGITQNETEFWVHVITGLKVKCYSLLFDYNGIMDDGDLPPSNKRDAQMAGNLLWLSETKYPGKKIIVWGANFHCCRGFSNIEFSKQRSPVLKRTYTMGDSLYKTIGAKSYSISFTCYESEFNGIAADSTLELSLEHAGLNYAFLNLRDSVRTKCIGNNFVAGVFMREERGNWPKVTDGLFFIKEIRKSNIKK